MSELTSVILIEKSPFLIKNRADYFHDTHLAMKCVNWDNMENIWNKEDFHFSDFYMILSGIMAGNVVLRKDFKKVKQ